MTPPLCCNMRLSWDKIMKQFKRNQLGLLSFHFLNLWTCMQVFLSHSYVLEIPTRLRNWACMCAGKNGFFGKV